MSCSRYLLIALLVLAFGSAAQAQVSAPKMVRIGMIKSIFRDIPDPVVSLLMVPFNSMMQMQTGLSGKIETVNETMDLANQLETKKLHLGVFHGFEFAWAQEHYPNLKPLMIAVNRDTYLSAAVVTRKDSKAAKLDDLKGGCLSVPRRSRGHCYLFLERHCAKCGSDEKEYFGKIINHSNAESALDDVIRGKVDGMVVDGVALDCYRNVKPGCYNRLKFIEKSITFPAAVIAYREGAIDPDTLNRFRSGMINANKNPKSKQLMTLWKLTAFEPIPADFQNVLDNVRQVYPAPAVFASQVEPATKLEME